MGHGPTLREAVADGCSHPDLLAARVTLPCFSVSSALSLSLRPRLRFSQGAPRDSSDTTILARQLKLERGHVGEMPRVHGGSKIFQKPQ